MSQDTQDTMTEGGSMILAAKIKAYWMDRDVNVWAERRVIGCKRHPIWVIRSDMVGGLPGESNDRYFHRELGRYDLVASKGDLGYGDVGC